MEFHEDLSSIAQIPYLLNIASELNPLNINNNSYTNNSSPDYRTNITEPFDVTKDPFYYKTWKKVSEKLKWSTITVGSVSIVVVGYALFLLLRHYRRSHYFQFLVTITILHLIQLTCILFSLIIMDAVLNDNICRFTTFVTSATSCYISWLWVMMFVQRFVYVFYPMHRIMANDGGKIFRIIDDTPQLILLTGIMACTAQLWTLFLIREVEVFEDKASACGPNSKIVNVEIFKWIAGLEMIWTYGIPFLITVFADVAVLVFRRDSRRFTTVCAEEIRSGRKISSAIQNRSIGNCKSLEYCGNGTVGGTEKTANTICSANGVNNKTKDHNSANGMSPTSIFNNHNEEASLLCDNVQTGLGAPDSHGSKRWWTWPRRGSKFKPLKSPIKSTMCALNDAKRTLRAKSITAPIKIQSENSLRACHQRRQRAIRYCLLMATMQLLLNLPYHALQVVDEVTGWQNTSYSFAVFYLYSDALFYILYMTQYPMVAFYVHWLHNNFRLTVSNSRAARIAGTFSATSSANGNHLRASSSRANLINGQPNGAAFKAPRPAPPRRRLSANNPIATNGTLPQIISDKTTPDLLNAGDNCLRVSRSFDLADESAIKLKMRSTAVASLAMMHSPKRYSIGSTPFPLEQISLNSTCEDQVFDAISSQPVDQIPVPSC